MGMYREVAYGRIVKFVRFTEGMLRVEEEFGEGDDLTDLLVREINRSEDLATVAARVGISQATLGYWLLKLGIQVKRTALKPGQRIEIVEDK